MFLSSNNTARKCLWEDVQNSINIHKLEFNRLHCGLLLQIEYGIKDIELWGGDTFQNFGQKKSLCTRGGVTKDQGSTDTQTRPHLAVTSG